MATALRQMVEIYKMFVIIVVIQELNSMLFRLSGNSKFSDEPLNGNLDNREALSTCSQFIARLDPSAREMF